jgi:peroxiredoxin
MTNYSIVFKTLIFIMLILTTNSSCKKSTDPLDPGGSGGPAPDNGKAPGFILKSLTGADIKLSDYNNQIVVLYFFGSTCADCVASAPSVESKLFEAFVTNSVQVLGLDTWNGSQATVQAFQSATGVMFPLLLNAAAVGTSYSTSYDKLVVIDKSGNIAFRGYSGTLSDLDNAIQIVKSLL